MVVGDLALTQTTISTTSCGAEEDSAIIPGKTTLVVRPTPEVVSAQEVAQASTSGATVVTSAMRELPNQIKPMFIGAMMASHSTSESRHVAEVETGSGSALAEPELVMDIMEELIL